MGNPFRRLLLCCALACLTASAGAETIRIESGQSGFGHGYLFGARTGPDCWIAVPAHVVRSADGRLQDQVFINAAGRSGAATAFLQPDAGVDLAFGRVEGYSSGCINRLPVAGVDAAIAAGTTARLSVLDSAAGGIRTVPVHIRSKRAENNVVYFAAEPIGTASDREPRILPGFSGAVIDKQGGALIGNRDLPLGMILTVCDGPPDASAEALESLFDRKGPSGLAVTPCSGGHYANAISFERITTLFSQLEAASPAPHNPAGGYVLSSFDADTVSGIPAGLAGKGDVCWQASPRPGRQTVDLTFIMPEGAKSQSVSFLPCDDVPLNIAAFAPGSGGFQFRSCTADTALSGCSIGNRPQRQIDIGLKPEDSDQPISIRLVRIGFDIN